MHVPKYETHVPKYEMHVPKYGFLNAGGVSRSGLIGA
jgi:hypothetical protein